jgi:hypothetical protein
LIFRERRYLNDDGADSSQRPAPATLAQILFYPFHRAEAAGEIEKLH